MGVSCKKKKAPLAGQAVAVRIENSNLDVKLKMLMLVVRSQPFPVTLLTAAPAVDQL